MKAVEYILLLVMLLVSSAATAALPVFGTDAQSKSGRKLVPPKDKAVIYIYQRHRDGSGVSPTIWLNNYKIGRLVPGAFTVWRLAPGQLRIRVDGTESARISMVSEAGKIYRFRLSFTQTARGLKAQLKRMPESSRADMAKTRWIRNPRKVTAVATRPPARTRAAAKPARKPDVTVKPGNFGMMLKLGAMTLSEDTQMILGTNRLFDDSVSGLYSIEAYFELGSGLTVGGEILSYSTELTTVGSNTKNEVDVIILSANAKKYFLSGSNLQPFAGVGIGSVTTDLSGQTLRGNTTGIAYQLMAGVEYRVKNLGVFGEVKYVIADIEDKNNESMDVSGNGFFAGIAFHF